VDVCVQKDPNAEESRRRCLAGCRHDFEERVPISQINEKYKPIAYRKGINYKN
jgi:hypothetical protein